MTDEPQQKHWYQDGGLMLLIVAGICWLAGSAYQEWAKPQVWSTIPRITGGVEQPLLGSPSLTITIWHQTPGDLKNGVILVLVPGAGDAGEDDDTQIHSFETWSPNQDQAVTFTIPLPNYRVDQEIPVEILVRAINLKTYSISAVWFGNTWKSNLDPPATD